MRRVLVTRPQPSAARTAEKLTALGYEPLILPLTGIEPVSLTNWQKPSSFGAIAITSENAVAHASRDLLTQIAQLPVYVVGERTGEAARAAGLKIAEVGSGDGEGLVRHVAASVAPNTKVLLLCGRVRRDAVERGLEKAGLNVAVVETYDTVVLPVSQEEIAAVLENRPVDAVLLYSALAAKAFLNLVQNSTSALPLKRAVYIAISRRVASQLPKTQFVHIAREPTEEAMFSLLAKAI